MDEAVRDKAYENHVREQTLKSNPTEVDLLSRFLNHVVTGLNKLPQPMTLAEPFNVVLLLAGMAFNSLRWSWELLLNGYYVQSNATTRVAWECWLHSQYLIFYPERLEEWKADRNNRRPVELRRRVAEAWTAQQTAGREEALSALNELYDRLSVYSHPNPQALALLLEDNQTGGATLRLGPAYDESLVVETTHLFCYTAGNVFSMPMVLLIPKHADYEAESEALKSELDIWRTNMLARFGT